MIRTFEMRQNEMRMLRFSMQFKSLTSLVLSAAGACVVGAPRRMIFFVLVG